MLFIEAATRGFYKKGVVRNFTKFTGKNLWQSLFFNTIAGLSPATLLKNRLVVDLIFGKLFMNLFLMNITF